MGMINFYCDHSRRFLRFRARLIFIVTIPEDFLDFGHD